MDYTQIEFALTQLERIATALESIDHNLGEMNSRSEEVINEGKIRVLTITPER